MSAPMSLRRAVEIVELGCPPWVGPNDPSTEEWERAVAILAAAVEAHEARKRSVDAHHAAMQRLEELERGE